MKRSTIFIQKLAIDFGGSTVDAVLWLEEGVKVFSLERVKNGWSLDMKMELLLEQVLLKLKINLNDCAQIAVTGGRSAFLPEVFRGVKILKVAEIEAIGRGGIFLMGKNGGALWPKFLRGNHNILVTSLGTGSCFVKVTLKEGLVVKCEHIGGTPFGGGTIVGLAKLLLNINDPDDLFKLAAGGDFSKVDVLVGDIVGGDFENVKASSSAAYFAKVVNAPKKQFRRADLAAALCHMSAQTLCKVMFLYARAFECEAVICGGKVASAKLLQQEFKQIMQQNQVKFFVPAHGEYISAYGC